MSSQYIDAEKLKAEIMDIRDEVKCCSDLRSQYTYFACNFMLMHLTFAQMEADHEEQFKQLWDEE